MQMFLACLVVVLATLVSADRPGYGRPSYGPPKGGYHGGPGYGHGGPGYGHGGYGGYGQQDDDKKPLDLVDKLYKRLHTAQNEIKTISEVLANLEARQSLQKKALDRLTLVTFPNNDALDSNQNLDLDALEARAVALMEDLDALESQWMALQEANWNNTQAQLDAHVQWSDRQRVNVEQGRQISALVSAINDFKSKLLAVLDNAFAVVDDARETSETTLGIDKAKELARMCETGQVTLDGDDRKAEYLFQTTFDSVPQVLFSICGYNFNLEAREGMTFDTYYKEPNAIGVSVTADASKTGVTLEAFDKSFGDSAMRATDVCFQACSISPGTTINEI